MRVKRTPRKFSHYNIVIKIGSAAQEEALWELAETYEQYDITGIKRKLLVNISNAIGEEKYEDG